MAYSSQVHVQNSKHIVQQTAQTPVECSTLSRCMSRESWFGVCVFQG